MSQPPQNAPINPWDNGSPLYRKLLMSGMGLTLLGVLGAIIGAVGSLITVSWTSLALIGAGILTHVAAQMVRFRDARMRRKKP